MSNSPHTKLSGTFGAIQVAAAAHAVVIDIPARNYDAAGYLHTDHASLRLPLNDAINLHAVLASQIAAADVEPRQPALWSDTTFTQQVQTRRYGQRAE